MTGSRDNIPSKVLACLSPAPSPSASTNDSCIVWSQDINIGQISWRDLTKDKTRLAAIIDSVNLRGAQEGVDLTPQQWEQIIKHKVQNAVKTAAKAANSDASASANADAGM